MRLRFGAGTDIGRSRERNEDSYIASPPLYAVADGMGGHRAGNVASSLAVEVLAAGAGEGAEGLAERVREANRSILRRAREDGNLSGMGTTVTAAFADEEGLRLAHVGDSRAYLFREGELRLLTEDHTLVHRMVEEGKISAEEAGTHPQRSILTRALGVEDPVDVDEMTVEAQEGDRFVLCSDGLYSMVRDETIREILQTESDPQRAAEKLVDLANHAGGMDNITVIVLDFEAGEGVEGEPGRTEAAEAGGLPDGEGDRPPSPGVQRSEGRASASGFLGRIPTRLAITVAVVVVVLVGALIAFRAYLDSQWYVGADSGHVAVFQGIPAELVGIRLSHLVHDTPLPAGKVAALPLWQGRLDDGITAESREKAEQIVASMAKALQASKKANR